MSLSIRQIHNCSFNQDSLVTDEIRGEVFCEHCGLVVAEKMLNNQQGERTFSKEQYLKNTTSEGSSKLYYSDYGIATTISKSTKDSSGNSIPGKTRQKFSRLRIWDNRTKRRHKERSLLKAFTLLNTLKSKLALSDVVCEKAAYNYRKAVEVNIVRGHSIRTILAASVYVACKELESPRSLDEIAKAANIKRKTLSKTTRYFIKKLEITTIPNDPIFFVNKVASAFSIGEKTKRLAIKFIQKAKSLRISEGKRPGGLVGGAIYLAAAVNNEPVPYRQLEKISSTSSVTIRKRVKQLRKELKAFPEFAGIIP